MISKVAERISAEEDKLECPYCKGANLVHPKLKNGCPDWSGLIFCPNCQGLLGGKVATVPLIEEGEQCRVDYPVSWIFHRYFCCRFGEPDPGPCESQECSVSVEELYERRSALEEGAESHKKTEHHPQVDIYRLKEKPMPKLYGGVRL